jgi:rod shape-determining protein MreD
MFHRNPARIMDNWAAGAMPTLVLTLLILISILPIPFDQRPLPDLVLIGIYLACDGRRSTMSAVVVFGLGLLHDLLSFVPLGLHAFVYVLVYALAIRLPLDDNRILHLWLGFVPVAALAAVASWLAVSSHHMVWLSPDPVLARAAASIITFPLLALPLVWILGNPSDER